MIVVEALRLKWSIPEKTPETESPYMTCDNLGGLTAAKLNGGPAEQLLFGCKSVHSAAYERSRS